MGKKLRHSGRGRKALAVLAHEEAFVGVDVHKATYSVSVWTEDRGEVARWVQPAAPMALARRLAGIRAQVAQVVYEAGPTGFALARTLRAQGLPAEVIASSKMPVARGPSNKSDRLDAQHLAELAAKGLLKTVYVPTEQEEADRQVVRRRHQVVRERRRVKHRIKSFLLQHHLPSPPGLERWSLAAVAALAEMPVGPELRWSLDGLLADLAHFEHQLAAATSALAELGRAERHASAVALLKGVPGVGPVTALTFRTELPRPERFATGAELASYVGLAPLVRRSGTTTRRGPIVKAGNGTLRSVLVEAAWSWVRCDPSARAVYGRLLANTALSQKAVVGVARRLAMVLWRVVTTGEVYRRGDAAARDDEPAL